MAPARVPALQAPFGSSGKSRTSCAAGNACRGPRAPAERTAPRTEAPPGRSSEAGAAAAPRASPSPERPRVGRGGAGEPSRPAPCSGETCSGQPRAFFCSPDPLHGSTALTLACGRLWPRSLPAAPGNGAKIPAPSLHTQRRGQWLARGGDGTILYGHHRDCHHPPCHRHRPRPHRQCRRHHHVIDVLVILSQRFPGARSGHSLFSSVLHASERTSRRSAILSVL